MPLAFKELILISLTFPNNTYLPQTFLIIWTSPTYKNRNAVFHQSRLEFLECCYDTFKGGCHICEIGNTATNN